MVFNPEKNFFNEKKEEDEQKKERETSAEKREKEEVPHLDIVLVFGIKGNEIEDYKGVSLEKSQEFLSGLESFRENEKKRRWARETREMMNIPAKMRAIAALEILKRGEVDELVISGGKTMGESFPSEAELMRDYIIQTTQSKLRAKLRRGEVSEEEAVKELKERLEKIKLEDKATNSIENFANVINKMDSSGKEYKDIGLLSNNFHTERLKKLAKKFQIKGREVSTEEKLKKRSRHYERFLSKACSLKNPKYKKILQSEERWKRGVDEMPLYFLPQAVYINRERLERIYEENQETINESLSEINMTWEEFIALPDEERLKLRDIPPKEWEKWTLNEDV